MFRKFTMIGVLVSAMAVTAQAQEPDIRFAVMPVEGDELPAKAISTTELRIRQGLSRSNALSENPFEVFSVHPTFVLGETLQSEGLVRDIAVVTGELTLSAVNDVDGTTYHSMTMPLKATATDGRDAALEKMASSIKATDAVFVRFVRQARQKILDYYSQNCSKILATAKTLADTGRGQEALAYLSAVSPSVECYDLASALMTDITAIPMPDGPEVADIPGDDTPEAMPDTVYVDRIVEVPVEIPQPIERTVENPVEPVKQELLDPEIILGANDMRFAVLSCKGDATTRKIYITARFENLRRDNEISYVYVQSAFDEAGNELSDCDVKTAGDRWVHGTSLNTPSDVPVNMTFMIGGFKTKIDRLSYVKIMIRNVEVIIKNLKVQW